MTESRELKEFLMRKKLLNMKKLFILKESQLKELSLIIMLLKPKSNTFQRKLKRPLLNMSQLKEPGKEFNIYQLKLKLSTTLREKNMLLDTEELSIKELLRLDLILTTLIMDIFTLVAKSILLLTLPPLLTPQDQSHLPTMLLDQLLDMDHLTNQVP